MRRVLLALPFALLPLAAMAHDHDHDHAEHASLGAHEHGVAQLNVALDGNTLEIELESPAMNLVGFEHAPSSDADKAAISQARSQLEKPLALFSLNTGDCSLSSKELESPLFSRAHVESEHEHEHEAGEHEHEHSEIHAHYSFNCKQPQALQQLELAQLFKQFPATHKIQLQLIGPNGQQGAELTPEQSSAKF
ncbi:DUF2796 domain-containing protein [Pseudomonas sp. S9]|uniref:DUF2796 domain-containing protein n=1 Tax=Pseudomonas sp. S9 TaxID=686578 RepID=UPI00025570CB|nr:DUF2796 domain-containing protein [Pseudomonas sp. S9]